MRLSVRTLYLLGFLTCVGLLGFGLYLQHGEGLEPCPLCILQRVAFLSVGAVCLVAALHGPGRVGGVVYSGIVFTASASGGGVAARQVWLQHLPKDQIPECGPGLSYLLDRLPLLQALERVLKGSGECADVAWEFLGLSIAGWALVWFAILATGAVALVVVHARRSHPAGAVRAAQAGISGTS